MKQAIIYARFSPRPNAEDCTSCEFQIDKCKAFCEARSFDIVACYQDSGISGKNIIDRPSFQQALIHVCKIHGVLVSYHLTRLSRGIMDAVHICETLEKNHADFAIVTQAFDTTTPTGRFMFYIMAAIGQLQREETVVRTKEHLARMHQMGLRTSGHVHYGWAIDDKSPEHIVEVYSEQAAIKAILRWRAEGRTLRQICDLLTQAKFKARGPRWHFSTVKRILNRNAVK